MNEIQRLEAERAAIADAARVAAEERHAVTWLRPKACARIDQEVARLRKVSGIRRGTSMLTHAKRNNKSVRGA